MRGTPPVRHVVILGLMGSGKTTVGTALARLLGWPLSDSDAQIEAREGRTVRQLRDELGTDAMHALETRHLLESLAAQGPSVICPAAYVAEDDACLAALRDPSVVVVLLTAEPSVAARRFVTGGHRPWYGDDPATFLAQQAARRYPRIRALEPIEVATDDRTPEVIVRYLADALSARGVSIPPVQSQQEPSLAQADPSHTEPPTIGGSPVNLREVASAAPAVTRAAALLEVLAEPGAGAVGPSDLARRLGLPKSSIANLCSALEGVGWVSRVGGRYELGPRLLALGSAYLRQHGDQAAFRDTCRRLPAASQETVQLATLDGLDVVYLARHDGTQPIRLASDIGGRMPAVCTGLGKAMLAQLDPLVAEDRIRQMGIFPALTPHSLRSPRELLLDLERTRMRGYAIDDEENTVGVVCFAVAIKGTDRAGRQRAVSVTMLKARATDALRDAIVADLKTLASTLATSL